jgi:hypothetical protein
MIPIETCRGAVAYQPQKDQSGKTTPSVLLSLQYWKSGGSTVAFSPIVLVRAYDEPVNTIEHEVKVVWDSDGAAGGCPRCEEVPHLKGRRDALDVGAAADHNGDGKVSFLSASGIPN